MGALTDTGDTLVRDYDTKKKNYTKGVYGKRLWRRLARIACVGVPRTRYSGDRFRSYVLSVMSRTRFLCATPL